MGRFKTTKGGNLAMKKYKCCEDYIETEYNYCPVCGYALKRGEYNVTQKPTISKNEGIRDNEVKETHPAYGQLLFSRRTGNKGNDVTLYGSNIKHKNTITLTISRSAKFTNEFSEHYFGKDELIEVEMSQSQFSEAITSMNMGSGVPVTIKTVMGRVMPNCQEKTLREKADNSLKKRFTTLANRLETKMKRIDEITNRTGTIRKAEKEEINRLYKAFITEIKSNLPFLKQCIDETVDDSIKQAKDEVESFWLNRIRSLGIDKLNELVESNEFKMIDD